MKKIFLSFLKHKEKFLLLLPCSLFLFSLILFHNNSNNLSENMVLSNESTKTKDINRPTFISNEFTLNGIDEYFKVQTNLSKNYNEIYPSQHFGNWIGVQLNDSENTYNTDDLTIKALKELTIKSIVNLPKFLEDGSSIDYLNDDTYLKIENFYIDNFAGQIVVKMKLNIFFDNSGQLIDVNKNFSYESLSQTITFNGFKKAQETIISNSISTSKIGDTIVTSENINDFTSTEIGNVDKILSVFNNTIVNGIKLSGDWSNSKIDQSSFTTKSYTSFNGLNDYEKIIAYPGLKQLRTYIGVENFFVKKYIDIETFKIYDRPASNNENYRQEIGTFCFGIDNSPSLKNIRTISFNYETPPENITTYIKEGKFQILPNFYKGKASDFNIDTSDPEQEKRNYEELLNNLFTPISNIIVNPLKEDENLQTNIEVVVSRDDVLKKDYVNDLTGELTLDIKVSGKYYLNGQLQTTNSNDYRIFTIVITGFQSIQATAIYPTIDISSYTNLKASDFVTQGSSINTVNELKNILIKASDDNKGILSPTLPFDEYINRFVSFKTHIRHKNNVEYLGVPNDVDGKLFITLVISSYYSSENGLLINANSADQKLILTATLEGFQKVDVSNSAYIVQSNEGIILSEYNGIDFQTIIAKDIFKYLTPEIVKNIIYDFGINGEKTENLKNNIEFKFGDTDSDVFESLNDTKTSNLEGKLNLHFSISGGILDKSDGIEIKGKYTILFTGFKQIVSSELNNEVDLLFINDPPFALDILYSKDWRKIFKSILLQRPENIRNLFKNQMGIPQDIVNLIDNVSNDNLETLITEFDNYFKIFDIIDFSNDQFYSKEGYVEIKIGLKTYYDNSGNLIIAKQQELYKTKVIKFTGFKNAKQTIVSQEVDLKDVVGSLTVTDVYDPYSSNASVDKIKELVIDNKQLFFKNIPNVFFEDPENFSITNPIVNGKRGYITFDINLKKYYFDANNNYVNFKITTYSTKITGFIPTIPSVIVPVVKNSTLVNENDLSTSNNLIDWVQNDKNNNPTNDVNFDLLYKVINKNIDKFIDNYYPLDNITNFKQYLTIKNPMIDLGNAILSFNIDLNYYYDEDGIAVTKDSIDNNIKKPLTQEIKIIGFNRNYKTNTTSGILNVSDLSSTLSEISVKNLISQNGSPLVDILNQNSELLNLIFTNLPNNYSTNGYFKKNVKIDSIVETGIGSCDITFTLNFVFVEDEVTKKIKFGTTKLTKSFNGFLNISETKIIEKNWDLNPNLVGGFEIAYWTINEVNNTLIPFLNNQEIMEKYIKNLVYDENGKLLTKLSLNMGSGSKPIIITPKNGQIFLKVNLSPVYDEKGEVINSPYSDTIVLRNFSKQNPTEVNQSTIYTNQLVNNDSGDEQFANNSNDPIFGNKIMSQWFFNEDNPNFNPNEQLLSILKNNGGENLINLMLYNTNANQSIVITNDKTEIKSVSIIEYNDFEGYIKFRVEIQNFFDENGNWISSETGATSNLNQSIFTIYQNNKTSITNLTKNESSISELQKYYDPELYENSIPLNPEIKASEFYQIVTNDKNFINFESFIESLHDKNVYGIGAINPPNNLFKNLEINVWNNNELKNNSINGTYKDFISFNDQEGYISINIRYTNVYQKIVQNSYKGIVQNYLSSSPTDVDKIIKIVGFKKDTSESDLTLILSLVGGGCGVLIVIVVLSIFLYRKARQI